MNRNIRITIGIMILAVLAALGLTIFNYRRAQQMASPVLEYRNMPNSVLPKVWFLYEGMEINTVSGYAENIHMNFVRENITPVNADMTLPVIIKLEESDVIGISFQVRSLGDGRLLEDTKVENWSVQNDQISVELKLSTLTQVNIEYFLDLILETETHGAVHYYTRIKGGEQKSILELLQFAEAFSEATFEKKQSQLVPYMLNNTPKTEENLAYVDLNSPYAVLTWAGYAPMKTTDDKISIKELGEQQIALTMEYSIKITEEDGGISSYDVKEFYCLRKRGNQIYILNYFRTMEEMGNELMMEDGKLNLGMSTEPPVVASSADGAYIAFVYQKELWLYETKTQTIKCLYSDVELGNEDYDILLASVYDDGTVAFGVYGYIGRGEFEGTHKLCWYEYSQEKNALTTKMYIPLERTYEFLEKEQPPSVYENQDGDCYFRLDNGIYCKKAHSEELLTISDCVQGNAFLQNEARNILAWQEATRICILNMDTGIVKTVTPELGQFISMEGLNGNDLVYGIGNKSDEGTLEDGTLISPLYAIVIMNAEGEEQHRYEKSGCYIYDTQIETGRIVMEQVQKKEEGVYLQTERDVLLSSNQEEAHSQVTISSVKKDSYRKENVLRITSVTSGSSQLELELPRISSEASLEILMENQTFLTGSYQVYGEGGLLLETNNLSEAISLAFDTAGTVTGENLFVYWFRSPRQNYLLLPYENRPLTSLDANLVNCMEVMVQIAGGTPESLENIWKGNVQETLEEVLSYEILNIQGVSIAEVLYYVDNGSPVLIHLGQQTAYLLVGYSGNNVMIYDSTGELQTMRQTELDAMLESANPSMYVYLKR